MDIAIAIFVVILLELVAIHYFSIKGQRDILRDQLTMARHTIAELAPKAEAWDLYLDGRRKQGPQAAAAAQAHTRVAYQHLSAECSDGE